MDWVAILFVVAIMFFKVIAMSATNAAGGVGGTFAPSLTNRIATQSMLRKR